MASETDIAAQLSAFVHAPIPYIGEAVLVAGVVWVVSRAFARDTIEALRERLSLATDRLAKANEEAAAANAQLGASQNLLKAGAPSQQIVTSTNSAQVTVTELVRRNEQALAAIAAGVRRGADRIAPASSKGPATKPDAPK
jgi:F0F1-type ATP synthase membrane subunit b/b'